MNSIRRSNPALLIATAVLCLGWPVVAQTQGGSDTSTSDANKSWSTTSEQQSTSGNLNPTRSSEKHTKANGRTVDTQTLERVGMDGQYVPYLDVERESVKVDATTTRTIERTYGRDPDGRKTLVQVTEEEQRTLPGGGQKVVRNVSSPDLNGGLQLVRREIQDTKQTSANTQETRTTVLSPDINNNGGLKPSMQIEERQTRSSDHAVEFKKSTLLPDGAGNLQVMEVRQGTIKEEGGQGRTKEESVLRPDADGKLAVMERTVSKEAENAPGEKRETVETYSTAVPGAAADGSLHLTQRVTTVSRKRADGGQLTEQQVEQRNPGNPGDSPRVTQKVIDIVRPGISGPANEKRTTLSLDSTGSLGVVWVDTGKTDNPAAIQVDTKTTTPGTTSAPAQPH
ncbi:MAG: hypothetical protein LAN63_09840 [Acidobacteriia bacterium]|nr:hypothetical protein [Terriglobia bacterium]